MKFSPYDSEINNLISEADAKRGIISIWGDVGTGKTTLCYGAALSILSTNKVIYINSRLSFKIERFDQMKKFFPNFNIFNFLLYHPRNFKQMINIIMNLEFLILKEIEVLGKTSVGLIIVDTLSTLRQLELGNFEFNQKTQSILNSAIATLDFISFKYNIPVILVNRAIISFDDSSSNALEKPANATLINYWSKIILKIERTNKTGHRVVTIQKQSDDKLKNVNAQLTPIGFI